jgi:hypothetical protein
VGLSEAYLDLGGLRVERRWPRAYDEHIMKRCPRCDAAPGELCVNPSNPRARAKMPCLARITLSLWN